MMKKSGGKKGTTCSKVMYDTKENNINNIFEWNCNVKNDTTDMAQVRKNIIETIQTKTERVDGNEHIRIVLSPPDVFSTTRNSIIQKLRLVNITTKFLAENFPLAKGVFIIHENQANMHCHVLFSNHDIDGKTIRVDNIQTTDESWNRLLKTDYKEEMKDFEERKEKGEVNKPIFRKEIKFIEKTLEKKEVLSLRKASEIWEKTEKGYILTGPDMEKIEKAFDYAITSEYAKKHGDRYNSYAENFENAKVVSAENAYRQKDKTEYKIIEKEIKTLVNIKELQINIEESYRSESTPEKG